jgi:flagellar hook-basal body complex protein FliE
VAIDPLTLSSVAGSVTSAPKPGGAVGGAGTASGSFGDALGKMIDSVEQSSSEANTAVSGMLDKTTDVHDAMIALQRSELALQLTVQVRNKFVQAYQEIMRMPI